MLGTIVNAVAILIGGAIGLLLKGGIKEKYQNTVMIALSLSVIYVGASGAISGLMEEDAEALLFIISLVIGSVVGEWLDIEARLKALGDWIEVKLNGKQGDKASNVSIGFVTASLIFCVGSMAILGSIDSGISGNHTTLYIKSMLDGTMSIVLASTVGVGVLFSAVSVFVYQGSITLFAQVLQPFITADMIRELSIVGGVLISCIGINMLKIKAIKVGNMLPAILIPVLYYLPPVQAFFNLF
ncbi:MAG: DUF554 domain-containing protein [Faecalibacterium sp.]